MNLEKSIVFFLASLSAVAGFAPCRDASFVVRSQQSTSFGRTALFSEVEEATEAAADEPQAPAFDTSIYVGNVSFDLTADELTDAFAAHGEVVKVTMPTDRNTGRARGFAFVQMANAEAHAAAINALNESEMAGRTIYVSESLPKDQVADNKKKFQKNQKDYGTKIYVGNLNFGTTSETLVEAFGEFGEVKDCFVPVDYDGNQRGFAFIQMDEEDALKAIEALNGSELDGRTLNVNKSLPKGQKAKRRDVKLYVGNLSWGTEEASLRELFEEYGKVVDCYIPTDRETGQHRGFAFVTMDPDDAMRAADETDGYELDGRILRVNEAQPKGYARSYDESYDGGDVYDEASDESWGNDGY